MMDRKPSWKRKKKETIGKRKLLLIQGEGKTVLNHVYIQHLSWLFYQNPLEMSDSLEVNK